MGLWKWFPHPPYGNYCGKWNTKPKEEGVGPVDDLDSACQLHDYTGDDELFAELLREPMQIDNWYGRLYRGVAKLLFRL